MVSGNEKRLLRCLRIDGPTSIAALIRGTRLRRAQVTAAMCSLRQAGLADRIGEAQYDVTERGRSAFDQVTAMPLLDGVGDAGKCDSNTEVIGDRNPSGNRHESD